MVPESTYHRLVSDEPRALLAPARAVLLGISHLYKIAIDLRNRRYDRGSRVVRLPVPVISVGNLTAGGTGKTPLVIDVARRLEQMGRSPAVLSRGYKAAAGEPNDEERLIRGHCPSVICLADRNRARAGVVAVNRFGADVIVLDDGFQHRRLARDLDIVTIDTTCPFGYGHLLPRGLLREPVYGLRRAQLIVLTRCDQVAPASLARILARVRGLCPDTQAGLPAQIVQCRHRVTGIETLDGHRMEEPLQGRRAILFAGIAKPLAFLTTARSLGLEIVGQRWWPDHHRYVQRDIDGLFRSGRFPQYDMLLTTEKDATKLKSLPLNHANIHVLKVSIDFLEDGATILQGKLTSLLKEFCAA